MKKILNFLFVFALCTGVAQGAVRDGNAISRGGATQKTTQQRVTTTVNSERSATRIASPRTTSTAPRVTSRAATNAVSARAATTQSRTARTNASNATVAARGATARATGSATRDVTRGNTVSAVARAAVNRAALDASSATMGQTRVGAEYEQCKAAYFACMDQFCQLKNDDYRRCSCSNRVTDLAEKRKTLTDAGQQLTTFTENLDVVGMTAAEATAMRTSSEGENALGADGSASKALLQAIMNSIRGEDATVGGKMSDLNSINISFDATNAFGTADAGQIIAAYNGQTLYSAVYPQCRNAVAADCNDASLQRAITAYLMAVEQDCNTVQTAIENTQKQMKSAVREGGAMLDLARVENRKNHNSSDLATCIAEIESAILSEEVCGTGYHKCLDNGEFIDITTGAPIAGVSNFNELEELLTFATGVDAADQKLSQISNNRTFVQSFEKRVKKFAKPALDKCVENADDAWAQYLDKALLDIYYAQKSKVSEIKQGCFDFVAACYMNADTAMTAAMKELTADSALVLQPGRIELTNAMCTDYIESCSNMFNGDIIKEYIANIKNEDATTACRAVAAQCFSKFGGNGYANFYYPYSGLNAVGKGDAMQWFSLYELYKEGSDCSNPKYPLVVTVGGKSYCARYKSECANQLANVPACSDSKMIEKVFGGLDYIMPNINGVTFESAYGVLAKTDIPIRYGLLNDGTFKMHELRSTGVATEVYNQILDTLTTQCKNLDGRFVLPHQIKKQSYNHNAYCWLNVQYNSEYAGTLAKSYGLLVGENMCPRDYSLGVDTQSWGACLCWENGGRRSKNGLSAKCMPIVPSKDGDDSLCKTTGISGLGDYNQNSFGYSPDGSIGWCTVNSINENNQVCLLGIYINATEADKNGKCISSGTDVLNDLPEGIK